MDVMVVLKATLLLSLTLIAARCLARAPAAARHRLWSLAFVAVLALPFLAFALPDLHVATPDSWTRLTAPLGPPESVTTAPNVADTDAATHPAVPGRPVAPATTITSAASPVGSPGGQFATSIPRSVWSAAPTFLLAAWLVGAIAASLTLGLSLVRARRVAHGAELLEDAEWREAADGVGTRLGLRRRVRLLASPDVTTPMAGGMWTPTVFLPACARDWCADRREIVLAHEIAHLAGRDPLRHVVARLAVALYWFHPLAWVAAREAEVSREQACDEAVLALGTRPSVYARVLLDLAESMHAPAPPLGALPMVEHSLLEKRLMAILNNDGRSVARRTAAFPAIAVALLTLAVAAAEPVRSGSAAAPESAAGDGAGPTVPETVTSSSTSQPPRAAAQANVPRDSACRWDFSGRTPFEGSRSSSNSAGGIVIHEEVGSRGADRVIQKSFGDLRLCMVAVDVGPQDEDERPSQWIGRADRVVMEARRGSSESAVQRLEIGRQTGSGQRVSWRVGSAERPYDDSAERWRERMLAMFDTTWELSRLRGRVSSLHGEISSVRGEESSLRGEISSLHGEVSSMHGEASSIRGEESSLRGEISSIEGHLSSLRGEISSERGQISALRSGGGRLDESTRTMVVDLVRKHEAEIERVEKEIRAFDAHAKIAAVEKQIAELDAAGKVARIEDRIRAFDLAAKVARVEREIDGLDVDGKVAAIERQIKALDADSRSRKLEGRFNAQLKELRAAIAAIRY